MPVKPHEAIATAGEAGSRFTDLTLPVAIEPTPCPPCPALFVSHGAPTCHRTRRAGALLRAFRGHRGCARHSRGVAALDDSLGVVASASLKPATIHDFGGFCGASLPARSSGSGCTGVWRGWRRPRRPRHRSTSTTRAAWITACLGAADAPVSGMRYPGVPGVSAGLIAPAQFPGASARQLAGLARRGCTVDPAASPTTSPTTCSGAVLAAPYAGEFADRTAARLAVGDVEALRLTVCARQHAGKARHPTDEHLDASPWSLMVPPATAGVTGLRAPTPASIPMARTPPCGCLAFGVAARWRVDEEAREGQAVAPDRGAVNERKDIALINADVPTSASVRRISTLRGTNIQHHQRCLHVSACGGQSSSPADSSRHRRFLRQGRVHAARGWVAIAAFSECRRNRPGVKPVHLASPLAPPRCC